jgi:glutaredoxin 3
MNYCSIEVLLKMAEIIVYSTSTCPYCVMAKKFFSDKKLEFEEVNVGLNQEKAREMIKKSGQMGVPVIDIAGEIIIGFDKPKMEAVLKKKKLV